MIRAFFITLIFSSMQVQAQSTMMLSGQLYKPSSAFKEKMTLSPSVFYVSEPDYLTVMGLVTSSSPEASKGCENNSSNAFRTPRIDDLGKVFMQVSCKEVDKYKEIKKLDPQICLQLASCLQTKMKISDSDRFELLRNAREKTAQDAIAMMSKNAIDPMFKFEELKKYAFDKYGPDEMPEECFADPLSIPEDGLCRTQTIDRGFEIAQQICKIPDAGCQPGYSNFIADKKAEEGKSSLLSTFIKEQSAKKSSAYQAEDSRITQEIAVLMTDKSVIPSVRIKNILEYLRKNHNDLDPIFKSYFDESTKYITDHKTDEVEAGLLKYIQANAKKSTLEVLVDLEKLRKVKGHEMLKEQCPKVMTVKNLCKIASDVMVGAEIVVPEKNFEKLLAKDAATPKNPKMSKIDMVQYVSRCNTFVLDNATPTNKGILVNLGGDRDLFTSNESGLFMTKTLEIPNYNMIIPGFGMGMGVRTTYKVETDGSVSKKEGTYTAEVEKISSMASTKSSGSSSSNVLDQFANNVLPDSFKKIDYKAVRSEKIEVPDVGSISKKDDLSKSIVSQMSEGASVLPSQGQQALMANNLHPIASARNQNTTMIDTSMSDFSNKPDVVSKNNSGNADYNQLMSKISGLEDKLAQAQKKNSAPSTDSDVKVDPKSQEENDLIKELKNAKNTLSDLGKDRDSDRSSKAVSASSSARKKDAKENDADADDSSVIVSSASSASASRSTASASPAAAATHSAGGAAESSSERNSSAPEEVRSSSSRGSSGGSGDSSSGANGDNIVLTRLDGISHTKVNETINNMIVAEAGKPFYIEEGGMVKQIIPEVVDGKVLLNEDGTPIYKKVVKGKVGQFKIDSKDKSKKEIAKSSSPADVKMQDYQVTTPAVRYKELQDAFTLKK